MTYEQATQETVSKEMALKEVRNHGCSIVEFLEEMGNHKNYEGAEVLAWLGY